MIDDPVPPHMLYRRGDPSTSERAAYASIASRATHRQRILHSLKKDGRGTFYEIAFRIGLKDSQVWKRLPDLEKAGLVRKDGERMGEAGTPCTVWAATDNVEEELSFGILKRPTSHKK